MPVVHVHAAHPVRDDATARSRSQAVLDLPAAVGGLFISSGLAGVLGFGSAPPPSAYATLERCITDPANTPFTVLVAAWVGVLQAVREGNIDAQDKRRVARLAEKYGVPGRSSGGFTVGCTVDIRRLCVFLFSA